VRPLTAAAADGEQANDCGRRCTIVYIDQCALTRPCVAAELRSLLLPQYSLTAFSTLAEATVDPAFLNGSCCIIYHAQSLPIEDRRITRDLGLIREVLNGIPIVLLSSLEEGRNIIGALGQGVAGYIPTSLSPRIASQVVRLVLVGGVFIPASVVSSRAISEALPRGSSINHECSAIVLTPRQREVLNQLSAGKQNKTIAQDLGMSENTVKVHVKNIMKKLGTHNRTQAVLVTQQMFGGSEPLDGQIAPAAAAPVAPPSACPATNGSGEIPQLHQSSASRSASWRSVNRV
jgi:DNA-binding NarL/FixJ family response regulator